MQLFAIVGIVTLVVLSALMWISSLREKKSKFLCVLCASLCTLASLVVIYKVSFSDIFSPCNYMRVCSSGDACTQQIYYLL